MKIARDVPSNTQHRTITASLTVEKFVGRRRELDHLHSVLHEVSESRGHICMVVGEPGIGKTRLAEEVELLARRMSFLTTKGSCIEERGVPPLWPWIQALRSCVEFMGTKAVRKLFGNHYAYLRDLLSASGTRLGPLGQELMTLDGAQFGLYSGFARLFRNLSGKEPLLVILEDLQWADNESLRLLEFVSREVSQERICVIGTYRDRGSSGNCLDESIGFLQRERCFTRYYLDGLTVEESSQYLQTLSGLGAEPETVEKVFALTDGNPLFVKQIAAGLLRGDVFAGGSLELLTASEDGVLLHQGFDGMIAARFIGLSETAQRIVMTASLLSDEIDPREIKLIEQVEAETVITALDEARSCHLLDYIGGDAAAFRFSHLLIKKLIAGRITPTERFRLHAKIAAYLEERFAANLPAHAAELVHHSLSAGALIDPDKVGYHAYLAGAQAMRLYDCERALSFFRNGVDQLEVSVNHSLRGKLFQGAGQAATHVIDVGKAWAFEYFEKAAESYICANDVDGLKSLLHCDEMLELVVYSFFGKERIFGELLTFLPERSGLWRWTQGLLGGLLTNQSIESKEGVEILNRIADLAGSTGDTILESFVCTIFAWLYYRMGQGERSLEFASRGRELSKRGITLFVESESHLFETHWLFEFERHREYKEMLSEYRTMAENTGYPRALRAVRLLEMRAHMREGEWTKARAACDEMGDIAGRMNTSPGLYILERGRIALFTGDDADIDMTLSLVKESIQVFPNTMNLCSWLIEYALVSGDLTIVDELEDAAMRMLGVIQHPKMLCSAHVALGVGAMLRVDEELLREQLRQVDPNTAEFVGDTLRHTGVLSLAAGEVGTARVFFEAALKKYRYDKPNSARTHLHLGKAYLATCPMRSRKKGAHHLNLALEQARSLGMPPLEKRALLRIEEHGLIIADGKNRITRPAGLTPREAEVLKLLAAGKQDKEIAYDLEISLSTVHNHVSNILGKTESGNRTEAGRFAAKNGLL